MLTILVSQLLVIAAVSGIGSAFLAAMAGRTSGLPPEPHQRIMVAGVIGLLALTVVGTVLNFFIPLGPGVSGVTLAAGLSLLLVNRRFLLEELSAPDYAALAGVAAVIWILSLPGVSDGDTGAYHLQAIRWLRESTVPLGLANLHGRLGYNSSWFVAAAMVEFPFGARSPFILNPVLLFFYCGMVMLHFRRKTNRGSSGSDAFLLLTIIPAVWSFFTNSVASTSTDLPVMLLTFLIFFFSLTALESGTEDRTFRLLLFALASFALTIKLSSIVLFLFTAFFCFSPLRRTPRANSNHVFKTTRTLLVLLMLIVGPWIGRGIAMSGCVAFPLRMGCFTGLPWSVPPAFVTYEADFIRAFARNDHITPQTTDAALAGWMWLHGWLRRWFLSTEVIKIAPLLAFAAAALGSSIRSGNQRRTGPFLPVLIASLAGAVFWFFSAPDFRFGSGYLYSLVIALLCAQLVRREILADAAKVRQAFFFLIMLILVASGIRFTWLAAGGSRFASIPSTDLSRVVKIDGVPVYYPPTGDCWDAPLPCTTFLDKGLRITPGPDGRARMFWFER